MLNQIAPATEANSSGLFLKNYLEYIEDFPGEKFKINQKVKDFFFEILFCF